MQNLPKRSDDEYGLPAVMYGHTIFSGKRVALKWEEQYMRVVAFCGSARKTGNTFMLLTEVIRPLHAAGVKAEIFQLAEENIHGCKACFECFKKKDHTCIIEDDYITIAPSMK